MEPGVAGRDLAWLLELASAPRLVVMSAETEMAAYSLTGARLWSTDVEPSWSYEVSAESVRLDVMGTIRSFPLEGGPPKG